MFYTKCINVIIDSIGPSIILRSIWDRELRNNYTMGCPPVREDNPRALASGLSYVQVDNHGITILYHQHQCRLCTSRDAAS